MAGDQLERRGTHPQLVKNETQLVDTMFTLLGEIPAAYPQPPRLFWGFLNTAVALSVGVVSFLLWIFFT
jgi:hypothetical protein